MSSILEERVSHFYDADFPGDYGQAEERLLYKTREARILPIPARYTGTLIGNYLLSHSANPNGIYRHQSLAGDALDQGHHIVLASQTNSGKSRSFMAEAFYTILHDKNARVLTFYPLKNLNTDQYEEWKSMAEKLGLDPCIIGRIDGRVPIEQRFQILARSRILLATPDIIHSWLMSSLQDFDAANFLKNRQLTIIDELDNCNATFGTNTLFLLRRMQSIQRILAGDFTKHRYIGASATLPNAEAFFEELTGEKCQVIDEKENGAPQHERLVVHHAVEKAHQFQAIRAMITNMIKTHPDEMGLVFFDSRRAVEEMSALLNKDFDREVAIPQKAGQQAEEQNRLDNLMASGKGNVVIATPAMESGVHYDFAWGINNGLPSSKRNFIQRMGRIGRNQPGIFVIAAPPETFSKNNHFGSFTSYMEDIPVEDPKLYPTNQALQIANAFCYRDEIKRVRESGIELHKIAAGPAVAWPKGFKKSLEMTANPLEHLTGEMKLLIPPKRAKVQYFHTLRNISGGNFVLSERKEGNIKNLGTCSLQQAMIEYPPGAIVWHQGKRWRIYGWKIKDNINRILMGVYKGANKTVHHRMTSASISLNAENVIGNSFYQGKETEESEESFVTLVRSRIVQSISSFVEITPSGEQYPYRFYDDHELAEAADHIKETTNDYGPKRRLKMPTTGLLMHLPAFRVSEDMNVGENTKKKLFDLILDEYCDAMRIDRRDVGVTFKRVTVWRSAKERLSEDLIYFHDVTPGSLGLIHGLLTDKEHNIRQIIKRIALDMDPKNQKGLLRACRLFNKAMNGMERVDPKEVLATGLPDIQAPDGYVLVVPPGAEALHEQSNGSSTRVKIIEPTVMSGTYGYMIEQGDRKAVFSGTQFVTLDRATLGQLPAGNGQDKPLPAIAKHFVAASQITSDGSRLIAMHKKTGELLKPAEDGSGSWSEYKVDG